MPRAKRRCSKAARPPYGEGCRNYHPCPIHHWERWNNSKSPKMPSNLEKLKKMKSEDRAKGCARCRMKAEKLEFDHIVPRFAGGTNELSNFQWLCGPCHRLKSKEDLKKYKDGN